MKRSLKLASFVQIFNFTPLKASYTRTHKDVRVIVTLKNYDSSIVNMRNKTVRKKKRVKEGEDFLEWLLAISIDLQGNTC